MSFLIQQCTCSKPRRSKSGKNSSLLEKNSLYSPLADDSPYMPAVPSSAMPGLMTSGAAMNTDKFEPLPSHFELYTIIGHGFNDFITISLAKHLPTESYVAVRRTNMENCDIDYAVIQDLQYLPRSESCCIVLDADGNEIVLSRQLHHDRILPVLCTFVWNNEIWSVSPLMAFGSCRDLIHAHFNLGLPEPAISYLIRDTASALDYLHTRHIVHRGVRASHILISANGSVCLSGLRDAYSMIKEGQSLASIHDFPNHAVKSLAWFAPEVLEQNLHGYDAKSDIYSMGITCCELANGFAPYTDVSVTQMLLEKVNGMKPQLIDSTTAPDLLIEDANSASQTNTSTPADSGLGDSVPNNKVDDGSTRDVSGINRMFSRHFHNFVSSCVEREPAKRLSASSLLNHPFVRNLRRRTTDILPSLLHPVAPLSDISNLPKNDPTAEAIANEIGELSITDSWEFD